MKSLKLKTLFFYLKMRYNYYSNGRYDINAKYGWFSFD